MCGRQAGVEEDDGGDEENGGGDGGGHGVSALVATLEVTVIGSYGRGMGREMEWMWVFCDVGEATTFWWLLPNGDIRERPVQERQMG